MTTPQERIAALEHDLEAERRKSRDHLDAGLREMQYRRDVERALAEVTQTLEAYQRGSVRDVHQIAQLERENAAQREALRFYADSAFWEDDTKRDEYPPNSPVLRDRGKRARAILAPTTPVKEGLDQPQ